MTDDRFSEAAWEREVGLTGVAPWEGYSAEPTHYSTGEPVEHRCPFCLRALCLDPHPGCCGTVEYEVTPENEREAA